MGARLQQLHALDEAVTASAAMREVFGLAVRAARSRASALVWGESGTGKELVARAIHRHSDRVQGPFVAVNCKAFAGGVLESELFGHEKGAYRHLWTAAERRIRGALARCAGRRAEAARTLGVERTTLYRLMKKFGIEGE